VGSRIRKGDTVEVIAGKNKGARGAVLSIDRARGRITVERVNVVKRHMKPNRSAAARQGGIIEMEKPIHISNVALIHKNEPTRVGFRIVDGKKVRWSQKHDEAIDG
jgi:large subunit ribosomal protein L24